MNFIKSLKIRSFFSIMNEIEINFLAHQYTSSYYPNKVFNFNKNYFNKTVSFYGANASGKTSILKAIINHDSRDSFPTSFIFKKYLFKR